MQEFETAVILGYNSTPGLETEQLDEKMGSVKLGMTDTDKALISGIGSGGLEVAKDVPYPVGDRINTYDQSLLTKMEDAPFALITKEELLSAEAYQKVSEPVRDEMAIEKGLVAISVADGYHTTYEFPTLTNNREGVVNTFKKSLEESGADFGIIAVQKPFMRVHQESLIEQYMKKCTPYYTVANRIEYYLIRPKTLNQELFKKVIVAESDNRHFLKNPDENPFFRKNIYTPEMVAEDEKDWMSDLDVATEKAHTEFVNWLKSQKSE